jgi:hypothetical protein
MDTGKVAGIVFGFLLIPGLLAAQDLRGGFPSLRPDPFAAGYAGRRAGDYSWEELAEIALWASGAGARSGEHLNVLRRAAAELEAALQGEGRARGDQVLTYMHRKFLRSYSAPQTRLDTLLENGGYNCVSSAVLYLILARSQGLDVRGVAARDHAFAILCQGDESWDVETTNPYGFDPGSRREFQDQFGKLTGFAYVPARNYRDRRGISPLELVSLILHNRIAEAERRGRYAEAVSLALNRAALLAEREDPAVSAFFADPRQDLNERILNYGASLVNSGKEEEGLAWALYAAPVYTGAGTDRRWQEYIDTLVFNRVTKLCRAGQFGQARRFLADTESLHDAAAHRRLETLAADAELTALVNGLREEEDVEAILRRIGEEESAGLLPPARIRNMRDHVNRWRIANFHNRFASAYNTRDYPLARRILEEGLGEFPEDPRLRNDQSILERTAGRSR